MGFLDNFEKSLERLVNGAFTKTFKSELQPVEISGHIRAEMDSKASILSRDRILAPNTFVVSLSTPDFNRMQVLGDSLIEELTDLATKHAKKQGFQFGAALSIKLIEDGSLNLGQVQVRSNTQNHEIEWLPSLEVDGKRFLLKVGQTSIGRDASADIQINDTGLSRQHFAIVWDGKNAAVKDLKSTNGTRVNGRAISEVGIAADTLIQAGRFDYIFKVIAKTVSE
ncbi:MAG: FhaA domain-containing protein [Rhodoluna sp.]